ncbi:MAG: DNA double-strand break repair nuclease NurA [Chloroflexi bacterium]|nr:DNA double-strand break repair nuclease NurA [Chloroflexota bacterium]
MDRANGEDGSSLTLDLSGISRQIKQMGEALRENDAEAQTHLRQAIAALRAHAHDSAALRQKIDSSRTYWPVGRPTESLNARYPLPGPLDQYTVIATDGSQIEPDRHRGALCYLLNIGQVLLRYGPDARAVLRSVPILGFKPDDLHIISNNRRFLVQGHVLTVKRSIAEAEALAALAEQSRADAPLVGLQDGTLIMQTLEGWGIEDQLREQLTGRFLDCLERLRRLEVPIASYISRPRAADVVNALRVAECPYPLALCAQHCRELLNTDGEPCAGLAAVLDRLLFALLPLADGERSGLFLSSSPISLERYGEHRIHYFYLNVGREIARVEVPEWVARDPAHLALVHAVIYDQCRRGDGYPRSLAESHEKAVIGAADRDLFWRLVDSTFTADHLPTGLSQKERSKKIRGL